MVGNKGIWARHIALVLALSFSGTGGASADTASLAKAEAAGRGIGIAVSAPLPAKAVVRDTAGKPVSLAQMKGRKGALIVFFRSAAWCPYCKAQLKSLTDVAQAARSRGIAMAAISYDAPAVLDKFAKAETLGFPLYSDGGSRLIDTLKLRDPRYDSSSYANGVPYPTILLVGPDGRVKAKVVETDYKIRPSNADVVALLDRLK
ncbi:peroxiredoxin family protein [Sphingobium algorifonticola]|nr:peroxiredoxin family protein [Sphingobium algorifonticola]